MEPELVLTSDRSFHEVKWHPESIAIAEGKEKTHKTLETEIIFDLLSTLHHIHIIVYHIVTNKRLSSQLI